MIDISVSSLVKSFELGKNILDGLTFTVNSGERVGILGHNGCGKTTLFRILAGEIGWDEGEVMVAPSKRLGLISQIPVYPDGWTTEDVLRSAHKRLYEISDRLDELGLLMEHDQSPALLQEYDLQIGAMLSPVYSLLFDLAIKEALGRNKTSGNTYFITDEFRLLPNLQHVDDAVNFGRSLGVKFMIGVQNVEQVYEAYGRERAISILSGFMTSVCFNVNDYESKQYIKNLFGRNRKKDTYMSSVQTRGIIENVRDSFVVEDWDISRLGLGDAIIGLPAMPPFLFHFKKA